jgi:hypothetical protein
LPDLKNVGSRNRVQNLTTVSAEADEEGDSKTARQNRSGYFMIRGILMTLTPARKESPTRAFVVREARSAQTKK